MAWPGLSGLMLPFTRLGAKAGGPGWGGEGAGGSELCLGEVDGHTGACWQNRWVCGLHKILLVCRGGGKVFEWRMELEGMGVLKGGEPAFIPSSAQGFPILGKSSGKMHFRSMFLVCG